MTSPFRIPEFAASCRAASDDIWVAAREHPFVRALADATLPTDTFRFYQMQDARYLEAFSDACAIISTRIVEPTGKLWFLESARIALTVEGQLHAGYGRTLGYTPADVAAVELTPNNRAYQDHMVSTAMRGSVVEAIAAIVPCPWLYIDIGNWLKQEMGTIPDEHPYADWLRMYSDPEFHGYMDTLLDHLEKAARAASDAARARACEAFLTSTRYEFLFWQQAIDRQQWPKGVAATAATT